MESKTKKILAGVAGTIASVAVSAYVTKLLKEKPLNVRAEETKTTICDYIDGIGAFLRNNK